MTGPRFSIPFGVVLAAYGTAQLGSNPQWWDVATAIIFLSAAAVSIFRGVIELRARRRASRD